MKKFIIAFLLVFGISAMAWAADKSKGKIYFAETSYDFGFIKEDGGKVTHEFTFTNIGKEPITIKDARAQCGCTTPDYPKGEIAPGESGVIKVTYNPLGRPNGFIKTVTVWCSGNPGKVVLKIRGTVVPKGE